MHPTSRARERGRSLLRGGATEKKGMESGFDSRSRGDPGSARRHTAPQLNCHARSVAKLPRARNATSGSRVPLRSDPRTLGRLQPCGALDGGPIRRPRTLDPSRSSPLLRPRALQCFLLFLPDTSPEGAAPPARGGGTKAAGGGAAHARGPHGVGGCNGRRLTARPPSSSGTLRERIRWGAHESPRGGLDRVPGWGGGPAS